MEQPVLPPSYHYHFPLCDLLRNGLIDRSRVRREAIDRYRRSCKDQDARQRGAAKNWISKRPYPSKSKEVLWLHSARRAIREAKHQKARFGALPVEVKMAVITTDAEIENGVLRETERDDRILQLLGKNPYRDALQAFSTRADHLTAKSKAWQAYAVAVYFCRGVREAMK